MAYLYLVRDNSGHDLLEHVLWQLALGLKDLRSSVQVDQLTDFVV